MTWASLVPPSYPLKAGLGALYGHLILHFLLLLAHYAFTIESNVTHHHVQEGLGLIPVPCILKMKLVPPSLPRSSYVSSSFWFIL